MVIGAESVEPMHAGKPVKGGAPRAAWREAAENGSHVASIKTTPPALSRPATQQSAFRYSSSPFRGIRHTAEQASDNGSIAASRKSRTPPALLPAPVQQQPFRSSTVTSSFGGRHTAEQAETRRCWKDRNQSLRAAKDNERVPEVKYFRYTGPLFFPSTLFGRSSNTVQELTPILPEEMMSNPDYLPASQTAPSIHSENVFCAGIQTGMGGPLPFGGFPINCLRDGRS